MGDLKYKWTFYGPSDGQKWANYAFKKNPVQQSFDYHTGYITSRTGDT